MERKLEELKKELKWAKKEEERMKETVYRFIEAGDLIRVRDDLIDELMKAMDKVSLAETNLNEFKRKLKKEEIR